jgi:hypothetical protein
MKKYFENLFVQVSKRHVETTFDAEHSTTLRNLIDILKCGNSIDISLKRTALVRINLIIQVSVFIRIVVTTKRQS